MKSQTYRPFSTAKSIASKTIAIMSLSALLAACSVDNEQNEAAAAMAVAVDVATTISLPYNESYTFTGHIEAPESIELRPRVSGYIEKVHFEEGSLVQKDDLLFSIDDDVFVAEVARLNAQLTLTQSQYDLSKTEFARAQKLGVSRAISQEEMDTRESNMHQTQSRLASVAAQLEAAQLQLSYTKVRSPIDGKISRALITQGNYVNAGQDILSSLVSTDKVYAYFDVSQAIYTEQLMPAQAQNQQSIVLLHLNEDLQSDVHSAHSGYLDFIDNQLKPSTGTIGVRAVFENADHSLLPGLFARLELMAEQKDTILIDEKALGRDLNNDYVLVLQSDNSLAYRQVDLGKRIQGLRVVKSGLNANEKIVVNGLMQVRPGMVVDAEDVLMTSPIQLEQIAAKVAHVEALNARVDNKQDENVFIALNAGE